MGAQSDTSPRPLRVHACPGHAGGGGGGAGVGNQVVAVDGAARCSEWSLPILPHVRRVSHHHEVIFVLRPELQSRASGRAAERQSGLDRCVGRPRYPGRGRNVWTAKQPSASVIYAAFVPPRPTNGGVRIMAAWERWPNQIQNQDALLNWSGGGGGGQISSARACAPSFPLRQFHNFQRRPLRRTISIQC